MKNIISLITLCIITAFLSGCATKVYIPEYPDSSSYGKITVVREYAEPTAFNLKILANEIKAASIKNQSYATFSLPVGNHILKVDWPATASSTQLEIPITLNSMDHKYFYASQTIELSNFTGTGYGVAYDVSENLKVIEISPEDAQKIMRELDL